MIYSDLIYDAVGLYEKFKYSAGPYGSIDSKDPSIFRLCDGSRVRIYFRIHADVYNWLSQQAFVSRNASHEGIEKGALYGIPIKVTRDLGAPIVSLLLEPTDPKFVCDSHPVCRPGDITYNLPFPTAPLPSESKTTNTQKETTMVKTKKPAAKKTPAKAAAPKKAAPAKAPAVKKSAARKPCKTCKGK